MIRSTPILFASATIACLLGIGPAVARQAAPTEADRPALTGLRDHAAPARAAPRPMRAARLAHALRHDPAVAVLLNLRAIERLYRRDGRIQELPVFFREQLAKTENPVVRNFLNYRIAALELRGDDATAALDTLRRNLEENYRRL